MIENVLKLSKSSEILWDPPPLPPQPSDGVSQPGEQVEGRLVIPWSVYAEGLHIRMSVQSRAGFSVRRVPEFVWLSR